MPSIAGMGSALVSKGRFTTVMFLDWKQHGPLVELDLKLSTRFFTSEYSCHKVCIQTLNDLVLLHPYS